VVVGVEVAEDGVVLEAGEEAIRLEEVDTGELIEDEQGDTLRTDHM
jgi:hypothetical protein